MVALLRHARGGGSWQVRVSLARMSVTAPQYANFGVRGCLP